ncbi:methyltransferase domain-containing protein [uncultured Draconibacterium sp.]|uniref:class I SAM-dependent methyltransferase n=1 Tax=uncultured Draconibacterium sp. TaxID=1573823 RepID=UPI0029C70EB9|nr:methyltransferase domain-containing protein [uncultured Draconibacterium sp.]
MHTQKGYNYNGIPPGYYDKVYRKQKGIQSKWHNLKFEKIINILEQEVEWETLLDIACGPGTLIAQLPEEKFCTGIDISSQQINYAKTHNKKNEKHNFIVSSALEICQEDNSFDVITAIEFIEHLPGEDITIFLKEVYRCLKPGGVLILTTPNYASTWPILEWILNRISKLNYEDQHLSKFTEKILFNTLTKNYFPESKIIKYLFTSPFLAPFGWDFAGKVFVLENKLNTGNLLLTVVKKQ